MSGSSRSLIRRHWVLGSALALLLSVPASVGAQSLTAGSLRGTVVDLAGEAVAGAAVTVEDARGAVVRLLESDYRGMFSLPLAAPGTYRILVEQVGFQPVRLLNVVVAAGQMTSLTARLERRPPPIVDVTEMEANAALASVSTGRLLAGRELTLLDWRRDLTDLSRGITELDGPRDGRAGLALSAGGLPAHWSRLMVDGVSERLLRHPGLPGEPASAPAFAREAMDQAQLASRGLDSEWRGTAGAILSAQSRRGGGRLGFTPYLTWSGATLAAAADDNPADSAGTSLQAGAALSGALIPDTLSIYLRADYQRLQQPTSWPWTRDEATYQGSAGSLRALVTAIAADSFGTPAARFVQPTLRTWQGASGLARVDWRVSPTTQLLIRAAGAGWEERSPHPGDELGSGAGAELEGRDISGALGITSTGASTANELRVGVTSSRRTWTATQPVGSTVLSNAGAGFGIGSAVPASFTVSGLEVSDAFQLSFDRHQIKIGVNAGITNHRTSWAWGSNGRWTFGDVDRFGEGRGDWMQVSGVGQAEFRTVEAGLFAQDAWQLSPEVQVLVGVRVETQTLPKDKLSNHLPWADATGIATNVVPSGKAGVAPRLGFVWDARNRGELVVRAGVGVHYQGVDPALFAEAMLMNGSAQVRRGQGILASWPAAPTTAVAPYSATRLTLFGDTYRPPRTLKADAGLTRALAAGTTLSLNAGYHHTDYLLRRVDLNRAPASGTTQGGRPVHGQLVRQGGLVSPAPGSNRRFTDFDLVSGLVPTGYADYLELTAAIERRVARGLTLLASYTFSRTEDNTPGLLSGDPADQLDPFPGGLDGAEWSDGRSDLDIPHRVAATLSYTGGGRTPLTVAARYRMRSGLPFTPGFAPGVDVNGDGSGQNDPVFYGSLGGATLAGCAGVAGTGFAARNSCRGDMVSSLDLRLAVGLPVGGSGLTLTVDAFNVVATATGLLDRAAVLVDPAGTFAVDGAGNVTIPLVGNPNFGSLLSRRGEPRTVRFGLRLEY